MTGFIDIEDRGLPIPQGLKGQQYLDKVQAMQIGSGAKVFRGDESGIWLGAKKFADAPFSVDMLGNVVASSGAFGQYISKTGTAQNMTGSINVANNRVLIDGVNGRIVVHDGTTNRVVIGDV